MVRRRHVHVPHASEKIVSIVHDLYAEHLSERDAVRVLMTMVPGRARRVRPGLPRGNEGKTYT